MSDSRRMIADARPIRPRSHHILGGWDMECASDDGWMVDGEKNIAIRIINGARVMLMAIDQPAIDWLQTALDSATVR